MIFDTTCCNFLNVLLLEANHVVELGEEDRVECILSFCQISSTRPKISQYLSRLTISTKRDLTISTWTMKVRSTCARTKSTRARSTKSLWTRSKIHLCEGDGVVLGDVALVEPPLPLHLHVRRRVTVCKEF